MRFDRRFALVVGFSLLWASLVSAVFYRLARRGAEQSPVRNQKAMVVAAGPLSLGTLLKPEMVKVVHVPENLFPNGGFSKPEEVVERTVVSSIQPDEALVEARLAARGSGMGLAPMIPPGMRAISVRVNDVVGVAGFVLPGMRVDVLVTGRPPGREETVTNTVLQNVTVLSAGQTIEADAGHQSINTPVVTLLVAPQDAEALTLANAEGKIQLVLRNSTDQKTAQTVGRQLRELYALDRKAQEAPPAAPPARSGRSEAKVQPVRQAAAVVVPMTPAPPPPAVAAAPDGVMMIRGNVKTVEAVAAKGSN